MSGILPEGGFAGRQPCDTSGYTPAEPTLEGGLASSLLGLYTGWVDSSIPVRGFAPLASALLAKHPGFDSQRLLDAAVWQFDREVPPEYDGALHYFINTLVECLYARGADCLQLDLTPLGKEPWSVASCLEGTSERPLRLACRAPHVREFGYKARDCVLELSGDVEYAAMEAVGSEFILHGKVKEAGYAAQDCIFRMRSAEAIPCLIRKHSAEAIPFRRDCYLLRNTFYVQEGVSDEFIEKVQKEGFFARDNRLFVPGEDGEWKEALA